MNVCESILEEYELKNIDIFNKKCDLILQEFSSKIGNTFIFVSKNIENFIYENVYTSEYVELFFEILKKYNYNMMHEIKLAMRFLGLLNNPNENKEVINNLLNSPVIQDISYNGINRFTISSEQYGEFTFKLASSQFAHNRKIANYIQDNKLLNRLPNNCHNNTYFISKKFPDFYSVTALCKHRFPDTTYYHSYTYDKDRNVIIDLCYNAVVDKDQYYNIFQPEDISVILNRNVDEELDLTNLKTDQETRRCQLLKIALYKHYLNSIGYHGTLEDAPSTKVKK